MESLWRGEVMVDAAEYQERNATLKGLQLCHLDTFHEGCAPPILADMKLRFRAFIKTERVPFYLLYGPRLAVHTDDLETEEHLWGMLVADQISSQQPGPDEQDHDDICARPEERFHRVANSPCPYQSETSILLEIEGTCSAATEVLLYAATEPRLSRDGAPSSGLITPPRSSSPTIPQDGAHTQPSMPQIRIFAQPLRAMSAISHFLTAPPSPDSPLQHNQGIFLPLNDDHAQSSSPPRKRPKLDTVFSAATTATQRARHAGGKSVSQLMARPRASSSASNSSGLARSYTTGSLPIAAVSMGTKTSKSKSSSRPSSRAGSVCATATSSAHTQQPHNVRSQPHHHRRGTSLHHVTNTASMQSPHPLAISGSASTVPAPFANLEPIDDMIIDPPSAVLREDETAEEAMAHSNKAALSRIVLAALRMWGHAPPGKHRAGGRGDAERGEQPLPEEEGEGADEEDFKALYHATYSAARFALRHHGLRRVPVEGEVMQGVVERVLGVFLGGGRGGL